ncbi:MAG: hypothetical protein ACI841_000032 [Planctomycetota bacterium]|jgi:hypothetical protein
MLLATMILACASAQQETSTGFPGLPANHTPQVEIAWNRLYDYPELYGLMDRLVERWPDLLSYRVIGKSEENREMRVYTLNNPATGSDDEKPAMWVDGNVHGNEVQAGEVVLYMAWYLLENYGTNDRITELVDRSAFYLLPTVNPDGRANWFNEAHSASSSRTGVQAFDNDGDGEADEDGPDDLNGDGYITQMRKHVPGEGTHRLNRDDPRLLERVPPSSQGDARIRGDWIFIWSEGIDNDGDGRINEDGLGGYDMNRAWPSSWMPNHVQRGAGAYPLFWPETRCVADFLYQHPNVAAVQSFHNAGGMILRGPGVEAYGNYPARDARVYDALGADGEKMLPFYRYMIIWKDLYSVFGGFATWTYEGLGIISFTNELWTNTRNSPDKRLDSVSDSRHWFNDQLLMGAGFVDWEPYDHPMYGPVEIGGFKKDVGRVPPTFLIEEMLHRNALFCIRHARAMPIVSIQEPKITQLGNGLTAIDVILENERLIPTRTELASSKEVGRPDLIQIQGAQLEVLAGGFRTDPWRPEAIELQEHEPERLIRDAGIGSRSELRVRWIVRGGGTVKITWSGEKARDASRSFDL